MHYGLFLPSSFFLPILNQATALASLNNSTVATLQPTKRRSQIHPNVMQLIIVEKFNVVADVLEVAEFVILKLLWLSKFESVLWYAFVFGLGGDVLFLLAVFV